MRMGKKGLKEVKNKPIEYENTVDENIVDDNEDNPTDEELDAQGKLLEQMI